MIRHSNEKADHEELNRLVQRVWDFRQPQMGRKEKMMNVFSFRPWLAEKYFSRQIKERIQEIITEHEIEAVIAETLLCAEYIRDVPGVYTIVDEHNLEFIRAGRRLPLRKKPFSFLRDYLIYLRLKRYELRVLKNINRAVVCSKTDRDILSSMLPGLCVSVIPNAVDTEYFIPGPAACRKPLVLFTGTLWYEPNADAVKVLAEEILPKLKLDFPEIKMFIVGNEQGVDLSEYKKKDIVFTGEVEDVRHYFNQASIFLAPIRIGSGTRLKILAAMSMGIPVVSTRIGCEGLTVTDEENIFLAETPEEFRFAVLRLLSEPDFYRKIVLGGRKLVEDHYSFSIQRKQLDCLWGKVHQAVKNQ